MRLSQVEFNALRTNLGELDPAGRIYLDGSHADDTRPGGDIDVYPQASRAIDLKTRLRAQYRLQQACDTQVDLLVKNPLQPLQAIHQIAIEQGVLLKFLRISSARAWCHRQRHNAIRLLSRTVS